MAIRIPLLAMNALPDAKAHVYPFQIGLQTLEFLQASILHASFMDIAAGKAVQTPECLAQIEHMFLRSLGSRETYDEGWRYLEKYRHVFEKTAFQSVLVALSSHWDWYTRKLGEFVIFARTALAAPRFASSDEKRIRRIGVLPILDQIEVMESLLKVPLSLPDDERAELSEMSLVRNLGLHNRWEVDEKYLLQSARRGYTIGDLRILDHSELLLWYGLLGKLVQRSSSGVACAYNSAPPYPSAI